MDTQSSDLTYVWSSSIHSGYTHLEVTRLSDRDRRPDTSRRLSTAFMPMAPAMSILAVPITFPPSQRETKYVSADFYRRSGRPSHAWGKMANLDKSQYSAHRSCSSHDVRQFGFASRGKAAISVLPIANASRCLVADLDVRIAGLLPVTDRAFSSFEPGLQHVLGGDLARR